MIYLYSKTDRWKGSKPTKTVQVPKYLSLNGSFLEISTDKYQIPRLLLSSGIKFIYQLLIITTHSSYQNNILGFTEHLTLRISS